jgi:hypothetical protein
MNKLLHLCERIARDVETRNSDTLALCDDIIERCQAERAEWHQIETEDE